MRTAARVASCCPFATTRTPNGYGSPKRRPLLVTPARSRRNAPAAGRDARSSVACTRRI
jgi:hypothetical protein